MRMPVQTLSKKESVLPHQGQFRMAARKVDRAEQTEERPPQQLQPDTERYLLQIDKQTKRSFNMPEVARSMALEIKARFPALQVSIYDNVTNSRTLVDVAKC